METYIYDAVTTVTLTEEAYYDDRTHGIFDPCNPGHYKARAIDIDGAVYMVYWDINEADCEDECDACDWDHPVSVVRL